MFVINYIYTQKSEVKLLEGFGRILNLTQQTYWNC